MIAILLTLAASWNAPATPQDAVQIRAARLLVGDGTELENALVLVRGGKIESVRAGAQPDPALPLIEHAGVVSAGIVVGQTRTGAAGEDFERVRSILPDGRMRYAFTPEHPDFERALDAGITSLVLAPSAQNLVGGLTCVVKSHGGTVVAPEAQLALSFSANAIGYGAPQPFFFFGSAERFAAEPTAADGGLEDTENSSRGDRLPTSYAGAVRALDELFAAPPDVVARAAKGQLPVLIEAWDRNEIARALRFAKAHGLKGALRGAPLAGDPGLIEPLRESGFGVVVGPFAENQRRRSLEGVAALAQAGVPFAFALDQPSGNPDGVRFSAAMAVQAGADPARVWKALTGDAAKLAGVDARVGLVAAGHDADLVFWSGHPLDLSSRLEAVYVDGQRVARGGAR